MTVHEKLDYLISKGSINGMTLLGTLEGDGTVSATSIDNYQNLTADDFIMIPIYFYAWSGIGSNGNGTISLYPQLSYDNVSGAITISNCKYERKQSGGTVNLEGYLKTKIYCTK